MRPYTRTIKNPPNTGKKGKVTLAEARRAARIAGEKLAEQKAATKQPSNSR